MRNCKKSTLELGKTRFWCVDCKVKKDYITKENGKGIWFFSMDHDHSRGHTIETIVNGRSRRAKNISIKAI